MSLRWTFKDTVEAEPRECGPLLPFTPGLDGLWLAPDGSSVCWAMGCGAIPAQSEMEMQIEIYHRGKLNMPVHDSAAHHTPARCWCGRMLCNSHKLQQTEHLSLRNHIWHRYWVYYTQAKSWNATLRSRFRQIIFTLSPACCNPKTSHLGRNVLLGNRLTGFNNQTCAWWYFSCSIFCYFISCSQRWCGSRHVEWWDERPTLKVLSDMLSVTDFKSSHYICGRLVRIWGIFFLKDLFCFTFMLTNQSSVWTLWTGPFQDFEIVG